MELLMKSKILLVALPFAVTALFGFNALHMEDKTMSADDLRGILKAEKIEFKEEKDDEEKTMFVIKQGDYTTILYQYGAEGDKCTSLQLRCMFDTDDKEVDLDKVNAWNRDERYTKAYHNEDEGVIALEEDLNVAGGVSEDAVKKYVTEFLKEIPSFNEHMTSE